MRLLSVVCILAVLAGPVAGCLDTMQPGGPSTPWRFGGVFDENTTQADFADFDRRMDRWDAEVLYMESFPVQFTVRDLTGADCPVAKEEAAGLTYVASLSDCRAETTSASPDQPTSDGG